MIKIDALFNPSSRWYFPSHALILFFLGLAIYYQTFAFSFVFDDNMFIVNNPHIKSFKDIHHLWAIFPKTRLIGMYSFALNYSINRLNPQGYHIFNFLIHFLTTVLVWALTRTLFRITGWLAPDNRLREGLAFIIALFFLVHPGQTQAVTYISQRFESIAAMFYIGSVWCYLNGRVSSVNTHKILFFAGSGCFAFLGILAKETAATIPAMILAVELILFNRDSFDFKKFSSWQPYLLTIVLGAVFVILFMKIVRTNFIDIYFHFSALSSSHDGDMITGGRYVLTQMRVFLTFLRLLMFPVGQNLDYDYPVSTGLLEPPLTLMGLGLIGFIVFLIFRFRKQYPLISFGLAWILITFSINTAPRINVIFEHKLYLISFGFFLATVCTLAAIIKDRRVLLGLLLTLITVLSLASYDRNKVWKSDLTLWNDVLIKSPYKTRPYNDRGLLYYSQGKFAQALSDYDKAIKLSPRYAEAYYNRGLLYDKQGDWARSISDYNKAIAIDPGLQEAYGNRGNEYYRRGNLIQAMADQNKAIAINPGIAENYYNRGLIYDKQGSFIQAAADYSRAIAINPDYAQAYNNRGNVDLRKNDRIDAMADYNKAIEIDPDFADAHYNRAIVYYQLKKYDEAWADLRKAEALGINVDPGFVSSLKAASGKAKQ